MIWNLFKADMYLRDDSNGMCTGCIVQNSDDVITNKSDVEESSSSMLSYITENKLSS